MIFLLFTTKFKNQLSYLDSHFFLHSEFYNKKINENKYKFNNKLIQI